MEHSKKPPQPNHVPGVAKGEEFATKEGREPGRMPGAHYRGARDSTGINPEHRKPIHPAMPDLPPA
jgi:hypothetical protein